MKRIAVSVAFLLVAIFVMSTNYYVSSTSQNRSDANAGTSIDRPWATMQKVNSLTFNPGDTVRFYGSITDQVIYDPGDGSQSAPIVFMGMEPNNGRAVISGITLSNTQNVEFLNFETATHNIAIRTVNTSKNPVKFIKFQNMYLHDGIQGVAITIPTATDITFENTIIDQMDQDGILLSDAAGDRFKYIGGSITNTGKVNPGWHVHGCYASGGTGHIFDGVTFNNNAGGWSVSIRRGGMTIRNCSFFNVQGSGAVGNCNEDEETGINHYTGSRSNNQFYMIYRNLFVGNNSVTALYQGNLLYNGADLGCDDPGNVWAIFNNTFVNTKLNFSSDGNPSRYYDLYICNNALVNCQVSVGDANTGKYHVLSDNGWYNSTYIGDNIPKGSGITSNPALDANYNVTAKEYRDAGTIDIVPVRTDKDMPAVTMVADTTNSWYFLGSNPDIGKNEYDSNTAPNIIPVAKIDNITPNPAFYGSVVSFKGKGTDIDGSIVDYEWSSNIYGVFSKSEEADFSGLSAGTHIISFRVKDDKGDWSAPAADTLVINSNTASLIADWKFNENEGTQVSDNSTNGNNGVLTNGSTWVTGKNGSALKFNNSCVDVPVSASLNSISNGITLSGWINADAGTSKSTIIERWLYGTGVNQRGYCLYISASGTVSFGLSKDGATSKWLTTSEIIPRGAWTYVAATFDGITMKIYINGKLSTSTASGFSTFFVPSGNLHIGYWQTSATTWEAPFIGAIDDVKIFNEALSTGEINNLFCNLPMSVEKESGSFSAECYPNPFTSKIIINYMVPVSGKVTIDIYSLDGRLVQNVAGEDQSYVGMHSTEWNAGNLASGLYLCKVVINGVPQLLKIYKK
jgi:hypothetical protein